MRHRRRCVAGARAGRAPAAPARSPRRRSGSTTIYLLADVSEPAFSPSGDRVAYTVSRNDKKSDKGTSDLWSVPWSGGKSAPAHAHAQGQRMAAALRQRRQVARFTSATPAKDETTQLWRMPRSGGGARQVTKIPGRHQRFRSVARRQARGRRRRGRPQRRQQGRQPPPIETERFLFKRDGDGLSRRPHAATVHRRPRHRQGAATDARASAITGIRRGRPTASRSPTPRRSAATPTATPTTKCSCRAVDARRAAGRSARRRAPTTIRTGARALRGRRIRAACCGSKAARTSGSTTRRRSSPSPTSRPARSRARRASIAGSTSRSSRRTARSSR